ncbi:nuclear transport factor 2 family protein [Polyangium jinanense]|uniref:Nuclear transport factor 2 family protein n=1 Tax=Polyangium jinanense TaxID=2829994 RepID=A0A9X3XH05_9BACT|nr:nuclear transport factor 2 family protein [Polyangium jinanense]MDC3961856.1 nuclear transport factor 2 family protein [Polyangium jinanense]MDC3987826.1 nuclear transport factor 2 family protein [Polyangium jinanense]
MNEAQHVSPAVDLALAFVKTVQAGGDIQGLVTDDVEEEELPNRIFAAGARRDLPAMRAGVERGKTIFAEQRYRVLRAFGDATQAVLELEWTGVLAMQLGSLAQGATMRAACAFFFDTRDGKIARVRHYDAFDPF